MNIERKKKILIGHLNANGDILYSSAVARQIKEVDYPSSHITWAVSSKCAKTLAGNPYIDAIWEIPLLGNDDVTQVWNRFCQDANNKTLAGEFDLFFPLQLIGNGLLTFNKTLRLSTLALYPRPISVPLEPILRLNEEETRNVENFAATNNLSKYKNVVLFECAPLSGQSSVTPKFALDVVEILNKKVSDTCFILSSYLSIKGNAQNVLDANTLSFRENAELSKFCTHLVGCSSGITWLLTSDWAKPLPTVQLLTKEAIWFNSVAKDHDVRNMSSNHILEMYRFDADKVALCLLEVLKGSFEKAKNNYHEQYSPYWCNTESTILFDLLKRNRIKDFFRFFITTYRNNNRNVVFMMCVLKKVVGRCVNALLK